MTEEGLYIAQEDNDCPIVVDQQPWEPETFEILTEDGETLLTESNEDLLQEQG